jgi:hypothetical protein
MLNLNGSLSVICSRCQRIRGLRSGCREGRLRKAGKNIHPSMSLSRLRKLVAIVPWRLILKVLDMVGCKLPWDWLDYRLGWLGWLGVRLWRMARRIAVELFEFDQGEVTETNCASARGCLKYSWNSRYFSELEPEGAVVDEHGNDFGRRIARNCEGLVEDIYKVKETQHSQIASCSSGAKSAKMWKSTR